MALRFLAIDPTTDDDGSPTFWLDEDTGDLIIQSYRADADTLAMCAEVDLFPATRRRHLRTKRSSASAADDRAPART